MVSAMDYYPFGMQMPGRYMADTSTHCFNTTIVENLPYYLYTYFLFTGISYTPVFGGAVMSGMSGDIILNGSVSGDGISISIDSLYPGYSQDITIVTDGSGLGVMGSGFDATILCGGTVVGGPYGISSGGSTVLAFTPTSTTATLTITLYGPSPESIDLLGIYLPRFDSFVTENVVTEVCNEDRYHYGYNGKLKDNEWAGVGNHYDYGMREYDPRIGRPPTIDPLFKKYPNLSPYQFFSNNPIQNVDLDGKEGVPAQMTVDGKVFKGAAQSTYVSRVDKDNIKGVPPKAESPGLFSRISSFLNSSNNNEAGSQKDAGSIEGIIPHNSDGVSDKMGFNEKMPTALPGSKPTETGDLSRAFSVAGAEPSIPDAVAVVDALQTDPNHLKAENRKDSCTICGEKADKGKLDPRSHNIVPAKIQTVDPPNSSK